MFQILCLRKAEKYKCRFTKSRKLKVTLYVPGGRKTINFFKTKIKNICEC